MHYVMHYVPGKEFTGYKARNAGPPLEQSNYEPNAKPDYFDATKCVLHT